MDFLDMIPAVYPSDYEDAKADRLRQAELAVLSMTPEALSEVQYEHEGKPYCTVCHRPWDGEHKSNCGAGMLKAVYDAYKAEKEKK